MGQARKSGRGGRRPGGWMRRLDRRAQQEPTHRRRRRGRIAVGLSMAVLLGAPVPAQAARSWSGPIALDHNGGRALKAVACPSASQCTGVDAAGREVTFNPTAPGTPTPALIDVGGDLRGVACPSASQCTAVDQKGREVTFNPTAPGTPTPVTIDSGANLVPNAGASPSASPSTAGGGEGREADLDATAP